ncbi:type I toxin-antitoxin system Fst family toxin [Staphylococcus muscae]|nr:type I toxin-antitoxin system Fst family toxin [Staphylococcus muscae]
MIGTLFHVATTVISGCIVALFAHWLRKRDEKK